MGGGGGGETTTIQDVPPAFRPAFTALFNSAFGAARTAAGQPGFGTLASPGGATQQANAISGFNFGSPGSPFENPFAGSFPQPTSNIFAQPGIGVGPTNVPQAPFTSGGKQGPEQGSPQGFGAPQSTGGVGGEIGFGIPAPAVAPEIVPPATQSASIGAPPDGGGGAGGSSGIVDAITQSASIGAPTPDAFGGTQAVNVSPPIQSPGSKAQPQPTGQTGSKAQPQQGSALAQPAGVSDFGQPAPVVPQQSASIGIPGVTDVAPTQSASIGLPGDGGGGAGSPDVFGADTGFDNFPVDNSDTQALIDSGLVDPDFVPPGPVDVNQATAGSFPQSLAEGTTGISPTGQPSQNIPLASGPPIVGQPFGEQFTAGTSPLEFESLAQREAVARQLEGIGNPLLNLGNFTAQGGFLDPRSNPFLVSNIEASLRPITQDFANSVTPQFNSQAIQSGAFKGSSSRDLAFNQLASGFGQQLLDTGTGIAFDNFQRERVLQQNAGQLLDQGALLNQLSPELLAQVGLGQRELAQRPLDEALLQFQESINAPFRPLFPLASIIQGSDIGGTFSTTVPGPSALSSGLVGAFGGGAAGAGIADLLGGSDSQGQIAAILSALAGGTAGALG